MISADTNIFIHAFDVRSPRNTAARDFLERQSGNANFVVCELVLVELYMALRNPSVFERPMNAGESAKVCTGLCASNGWQLVDYHHAIRKNLWRMAEDDATAFRQIIDARLGLVLKFNGVEEFATVNVKHFRAVNFNRLWNPLMADA